MVRGTGSGTGRRVQIGRARVKQWTARTEERFLVELAETCNVKAACAAVGLTPASAYNHRDRWPAFRLRWDGVLGEAMARLEGELLRRAREGEEAAKAEFAGILSYEAMWALEMHRQRIARRRNPQRRVRSHAELVEELTKKLAKAREVRQGRRRL